MAANITNSGKTPLLSLVLIIVIAQMLIISSISSLFMPTVKAGSNWIQTTEADFLQGALDNVSVTAEGNVTLSYANQEMEDDYFDESKIQSRSNLVLDTVLGELRLPSLANEFNRTFGGSDSDFGWDVQPTPDGGFIVASESISYGPGFYDAWLIKTDSMGNMQWDRTFGGSEKDGSRSIALTSDGGYILGGYCDSWGYPGHDFWLIRTDSSGNELWNYTYGGINSDASWKPFSVHQTTDGGYIITGYETSFGPDGSYDIWVVKTNSLGWMEWDRTFGGLVSEFGNGIQETNDGGYIIVGQTNSIGAGGTDLWLVKLDSIGNEEWNRTYGGNLDDWGGAVYQTDDGGFIVTGDTKSYGSGGFDFWLIKTDSDGNEEWNRTYGRSTSDDTGYSVKPTSEGGYVILGVTRLFSDDTDVWIVKTDSNGMEEWNRYLGGPGEDWAFSINETSDGLYVIVGDTDSYGSGLNDVWLLKVGPAGNPNGHMVSTNLLTGKGVSSIDSFSYTASIPLDSRILVQFSQDNVNWYDSTGVLGGWDFLSDGTYTIDLSTLGWSGPNFYYRTNFSRKDVQIPILQYVNVSFSGYYSNGELISQAFDCGSSNIRWKTLNWTEEIPLGCDIKFQIRAADAQVNLSTKNYVGPDGSTDSYYINSGGQQIWSGHDGMPWIQYKAYLTTTGDNTPILEHVRIYYNFIPDIPVLLQPGHDVWISDSTPFFNWSFSDNDGTQQGFQLIIDSDPAFGSIDYDSGMQSQPDTNWQFPTGTGYTEMADGIWYWKVRVQDDDGDWSQYSSAWILKIDTTEPSSSVTIPANSSYLNSLTTISGTASDGNGSGVLNVKISIKRYSDNLYWDGFAWTLSQAWLSTSGTKSWSKSTGLPVWVNGYSYTIRSIATDNATNVEIPGSGNTFTFVAENYTILKQGWNLISIPLIQNNQGLTKVLETIDGYYDAIQWYDPSDTNDPWKHHKVGKPFGNDLFELNETMGFWIHITQPGDTVFVYNGSKPAVNQIIPLHPGWNLVGYPSLTTYNRTEGLNNLTFDMEVNVIWTFDAATQKWKEIGPPDYFESGRGYWVHAKIKCEWEVPL